MASIAVPFFGVPACAQSLVEMIRHTPAPADGEEFICMIRFNGVLVRGSSSGDTFSKFDFHFRTNVMYKRSEAR